MLKTPNIGGAGNGLFGILGLFAVDGCGFKADERGKAEQQPDRGGRAHGCVPGERLYLEALRSTFGQDEKIQQQSDGVFQDDQNSEHLGGKVDFPVTHQGNQPPGEDNEHPPGQIDAHR